MTTSELVTPKHLSRKAIIYIRQSSPHQMISNQESLRLQYALRQRGVELGWLEDNIQVIDSDLGTTAATESASGRLQGTVGPSHAGAGGDDPFL